MSKSSAWQRTKQSAVRWIARISRSAFDMMIVDIFLKSGTGLGVLKEVRAARLSVRRVVLTNYATQRHARALPRARRRPRVRQVQRTGRPDRVLRSHQATAVPPFQERCSSVTARTGAPPLLAAGVVVVGHAAPLALAAVLALAVFVSSEWAHQAARDSLAGLHQRSTTVLTTQRAVAPPGRRRSGTARLPADRSTGLPQPLPRRRCRCGARFGRDPTVLPERPVAERQVRRVVGTGEGQAVRTGDHAGRVRGRTARSVAGDPGHRHRARAHGGGARRRVGAGAQRDPTAWPRTRRWSTACSSAAAWACTSRRCWR